MLKDLNPTLEDSTSMTELADEQSDLCTQCQQPIDDESLKAGSRRWHHKHLTCVNCSRSIGDETGLDNALWLEKRQEALCPDCSDDHQYAADSLTIERVTRLQQYVYLLQIALARLLAVLRSSGTLPHTSGRRPLRARRRKKSD